MVLLVALAVGPGAQAASRVEVPKRVAAIESQAEVSVVLKRTGDLSGVLEIDLRTVDGSALAGEDYTATAATLRWLAGEGGPRELRVPLLDDRRVERIETFEVVVDDVRGDAELSASGTRVLIEDDDFRRLAERRLSIEGIEPVIAEEPGGRRLVVFTTPFGLLGTVLGAGGSPLGLPFPIRMVEGEGVGSPDVASDGRGHFFVVWRAGRLDDVLRTRIEGRVLDRGGDPVGPVLAVSEGYEGLVGAPQLAVSNRGDAVVVFAAPDGRLVGRVFSPAEAVGGAGATRIVDLELADARSYRVDAAATGGFVLVAATAGGTGSAGAASTGASLVARSWTFGGEPRSEEVVLSSDQSATAPSVAVGAEGQLAVAWSEESLAGDLDVRVAFFGKGATLDQPATVLELEAAGDQTEPVVAMNAAGDLVAVWLSQPTAAPAATGRLARGAATGASMVARAFDPSGVPKGEPFTVAEADAETEPGAPAVSLSDDDVVTVTFPRIDLESGETTGVFGTQVETVITPGVCGADDQTLCLNDERFQVTASWANAAGDGGVASVLPLTDDTGTFWFFEPTNVEIVLKVLDACAFAQSYWVFAGGLTDVEVNLTITDTETGGTRVYGNSPSTPFVPIQDTAAFPTCSGGPAGRAAPRSARAAREEGWRDVARGLRAAATACAPETLCLNDDRFQATLELTTFDGQQGLGRPTSITSDTGYFWFFDDQNVEVVVKVLDACSFGDRYWVFAAGLTDVQATLVVTDTLTGESRTYENPQSTPFQPVVDTDAFASCP